MDDLLKVIIPPGMTCMIFAVVEGWCLTVEEGITSNLNCVTEEWDVDIQISIDGEGTGIHTSQSDLCGGIVVQSLTLLLAQLSTYAQCMFVEFLYTAFLVWQLIVAQVIAGECLDACLCPLAESFQCSQCQGILHVPVLGLVVDRVTLQSACCIVFVEIIVGRSLVSLVDTLVVVKL